MALSRHHWHGRQAPSLDDFEHLARAAYDGLPQRFRALLGDVVFRVAEFASDDVLDELGIEDPFALMGLFEGRGLPQRGAFEQTGEMPNLIFLYRRAILDYWAESSDTLGAVVTHVLVHEIGHHFGFSDADMEAIENEVEKEIPQ